MTFFKQILLSAMVLLAASGLACSASPGASAQSQGVTLDELAEVSPAIRNAKESVRISKDPKILNGNAFKKLYLNKLRIQNAHLKGGTFTDCTLDKLNASNVTFENFTFDKVVIRDSTFSNVKFINCTITDSLIHDSQMKNSSFSKGSFERKRWNGYGNRPDMDKVTFDTVVFDGPEFKGGYYIGNTTGTVSFKNIQKIEGSRYEGRFLFHGMKVNATFEHCSIPEIDYLQLWNNSTFKAKNCTFTGSVFWVGTGTGMEFENCTFTGADIDTNGPLVLRSCTVKAPIVFPGNKKPENLRLINTVLPAPK